METFPIQSEFIELFKLLKAVQWCDSGGLAKTLIAEGMVEVDGVVETRKRCKILPGQVVRFEEQSVQVVQG